MTVGDHPPVDRLPANAPARRRSSAAASGGGRSRSTCASADGRAGGCGCSRRPASRSANSTGCGCGSSGHRAAVPVAGLVGWLVGRAATRPLRRLQNRARGAVRAAGDAGRRRAPACPEIDEVAAVVDSDARPLRRPGRADQPGVAGGPVVRGHGRARTAHAARRHRHQPRGAATARRHRPGRARRDPRRPDRRAPARGRPAGDAADARAGRTGHAGPVRTGRPGRAGRRARSTPPVAAIPTPTFAATGPPSVPVTGWPDGLRCILDNLLDNAAVHGVDPGDRTRRRPRHAHPGRDLSRSRTAAPGVPPDCATAVFQRFTKSPAAPVPGSG